MNKLFDIIVGIAIVCAFCTFGVLIFAAISVGEWCGLIKRVRV